MRKFVWLGLFALLAGGGYLGYQYGRDYVSDRVMDQVVEQVMADEEVRRLLDDPAVREALEEAVATEDAARLREELAGKLGGGSAGGGSAGGSGDDVSAGSASGGVPAVDSVEDAEALVLEKFSAAEVRRYAGMASGGLTDEEKAVLQEEVMSQFTEEELEALKIIALMEAQKRQGG